MNRHKFRAWDKKHKQMIRVISLNWYEEITDYNVVGLFPNTESVARFWDETIVMQSSGLKDKNGVEIYEGDVLTSNVQPCKMVNPIKNGYGVVRFENGMFKLGAISLVTFISKMEVIGNIYENPELLEREAE